MPKTSTPSTKKAKQKPRNSIPPLRFTELVAEHRPLAIDAIPAMADKLVQLWADIDAWKTACRAAFAEGKSLPVFPASKIPGVNVGRMGQAAWQKLVDTHNDALDAGKMGPTFPPHYCPVEMELIQALGCTRIRRGQNPAEPKGWNEDKNGLWLESVGKPGGIKAPEGWEKKYGNWFLEDEDGKRTIPSGLILDSARQRSCHQSVDKMVENPDENIVTLGGTRYVIGAGLKASESAVMQMDCSSSGNYGAVWDVRRRLSSAKSKGIGNLVFKIEDRPNAGAAVRIDMGGGNVNFFMPGQAATPGYLTNGDGKELTPAQIRKAVADETKGIRFKSLKDPIIGESIPMDDAYPEIKKAWKASKRPNTELNALVQCRVSHDESYPFGFRGASVGIVPCFQWSYDGNKYSLSISLVIGSRQNAEHNISKQDAKAAYNEAHAPAKPAKPAKPAASKPAASKPTASKPTASKPTASKPAASKPAASKPTASKPASDAAAPIVANTSDEQEEDAEAILDANQRDLAEADVANADDDN